MARILMTKKQADRIETVMRSHDGAVCIVDSNWIYDQRGWPPKATSLVGVQLHYSDRPGWEVFAYDRTGVDEIYFSGGLD